MIRALCNRHCRYTRQVEALLLDSFAPEELDILTEGVDIIIHDTVSPFCSSRPQIV